MKDNKIKFLQGLADLMEECSVESIDGYETHYGDSRASFYWSDGSCEEFDGEHNQVSDMRERARKLTEEN